MKRWLSAGLAAAVCLLAVLTVLLSREEQTPLAAVQLLAAAQGLDEITIDASFDPELNLLAVMQTFTLTNRTGADQAELYLRAYASAFRDEEYAPSATESLHSLCYPNGFSAGGLEITACELAYRFADDAQTVLVLTPAVPWGDGETLTVQISYTLSIPEAAYRFGEYGGVVALGNAFLIPAAYGDGEYLTDEYYSVGSPFVSECRNYTLRLTLPEGYTAFGTGNAAGDGQTAVFTALACRDFAIGISQTYKTAQAAQDGVQIAAYARTAAGADALLKTAKQALRIYTGLYGAYPYPSFTLAEISLPFDTSVYPAFAMVASDVVNGSAEALEIDVARAVAGQWFQAVVGTDGYRQPWQSEALSEFALLSYWNAAHGGEAAESLRYSRVDTAMRLSVGSLTPGSPLSYFYDWGEFQTVVWHRGAAALCALDLALDGKLDEFLAAYYDTYAFTIASRTDFEAALQAFSGEDWSALLADMLDTIQ